jgi:hypothetical protein
MVSQSLSEAGALPSMAPICLTCEAPVVWLVVEAVEDPFGHDFDSFDHRLEQRVESGVSDSKFDTTIYGNVMNGRKGLCDREVRITHELHLRNCDMPSWKVSPRDEPAFEGRDRESLERSAKPRTSELSTGPQEIGRLCNTKVSDS